MTKNMKKEEMQNLVEMTSFKEEKKVKYLGIQITPPPKNKYLD